MTQTTQLTIPPLSRGILHLSANMGEASGGSQTEGAEHSTANDKAEDLTEGGLV